MKADLLKPALIELAELKNKMIMAYYSYLKISPFYKIRQKNENTCELILIFIHVINEGKSYPEVSYFYRS